jgi:hypothetical protein
VSNKGEIADGQRVHATRLKSKGSTAP